MTYTNRAPVRRLLTVDAPPCTPGGLELECQQSSPYARLKNATGPVMTVVKRPSAASNTIIDELLLRWWRLGGLATRKSKALALFHTRPRLYFEAKAKVKASGAKAEARPRPPLTEAKARAKDRKFCPRGASRPMPCPRGHNTAVLVPGVSR